MTAIRYSYWEIELFGGPVIRHSQNTIRLKTSKTSELLAVLALYPRRHSRGFLAERLWPDSDDPTASRASLRTALASLSRQLEPRDSKGGLLVADNASIGIDLTRCRVDVHLFQDLLKRARQSTNIEARIQAFESAIATYKEPLLPSFDCEWIVVERRYFAEEYRSALLKLTELLAEVKEIERAIDFAQRLVRIEPGDEDATRLLMVLHAEAGQRHAALKALSNLKRALQEEHGGEVSHDLLKLAETIRHTPGSAPRPQSHTSALTALAAPDSEAASIEPTRSDHAWGVPPRTTPFFGRNEEIWQIISLLSPKDPPDLSQFRVVTLTGLGGIGKTRLATEAVQILQAKFARFATVPLSAITDPRLMADAILKALSIPRDSEMDVTEQLVESLRPHPSLLLLDNFEQLLDESCYASDGRAVLIRLLDRLPSLRCLVTSRQPLRIGGESELVVRPLPVPPEGTTGPAAVSGYPSVQLYLHRAQEKKPDFVATERTAAAIAELCCRLDGIPLALELAAACVNDYSPSRILADFDNRFSFLKSRFRDISERHRTLYSVIDWSYQTLSSELQQFFPTLGIFRGGFTAEAATAISGSGDAPQFLEQLKSRSLILEDVNGQTPWFTLLDTLRDFARHKLTKERKSRLLRRHAAFYYRLTRGTAFRINGADQEHLLEMLERDHDNLRACLDFLAERKAGLRMTGALHQFWYVRGHIDEGLRYMEQMLCQKDLPIKLRSSVLNGMGVFAWQMGDYAKAEDCLRQALEARTTLGDDFSIAGLNNNLGLLAKLQGDLAEASERTKLSIAAYRRLTQDRLLAGSLDNLAGISIEQGILAEAAPLLLECQALIEEKGDSTIFASMLTHRGMLAHRQGDPRQAHRLFQQALRMQEALKAPREIAALLLQLAVLAREQGLMPRSVMLCAAATRLSETSRTTLTTGDKAVLDGCLERARLSLSPNRYASSWSQGYALSQTEAVAFACELTPL